MASTSSASSLSKRIDTTSFEDDERVTKVQCSIEENKTIEELKKPLQQTLETILTKLYSKQIQQKLTHNIVKLLLSSPCINTLKHKISDATIHSTKTINYIISTQADMISDEFKMYDSILSMIKIGEYKTASNIVSTIEPVLEEFGISGSKLVSIMTDNSSNVKTAIIQLSTKISPLKPVVNIFYAVYTLQLSVNVILDKVHDLIIKYKAFIRLLGEEKKCKQLREAQISIGKKN
ncbi:10520_t:CDS:2 [Cetraspora pellucida]|uniref:10520_t:CDS:1 n=1 Tax=Cetraspora pellucida TaxID=1433469 RepID=A0A9N9FS88_9GLOM|nr:10520_t:CDS:2 [Cetraspora pellucida]